MDEPTRMNFTVRIWRGMQSCESPNEQVLHVLWLHCSRTLLRNIIWLNKCSTITMYIL